MAGVDTHTRIVGWLKVALPLAALAILATLFLLADRIDPDEALPYAEVDVEDRARAPRITAPTYAGTTSDGGALTLTADEARPASDNGPATVSGLTLTLATPDGGRTEMTAARAEIDNEARLLHLTGGVVASTATGYRIATEGMSANLDRSGLQSLGQVTANGPMGEIVANEMVLRQDAPGAYVLVFNGAVKLVYQPRGAATP